MQFLSLPLPFLPDSTDFPQLFLLFSTVVLQDNQLLFTQWVFCHDVAISLSYGVIVKLRKENLSLTLAFT
ncbi:MAG: hypothetical protein V7L11_22330 [Nostoc sp.]|uniref:hypothetical protein n=1 Tax=Nostoc sp. TaxID=1180 RepID=UPI002FFC027F